MQTYFEFKRIGLLMQGTREHKVLLWEACPLLDLCKQRGEEELRALDR